MKVKCINNKGVERFLTKGKVYEVIECHEEHFVVACDVSSGSAFAKGRFEIVPSIDDVIKDKEKEKRPMNGLEAIELMKQGKIVNRKDTSLILKIEHGLVKSCLSHDRKWVLNEYFNFQHEYEEYFEPSPTGWHIADQKINFFMIHGDGEPQEERYWHQLDYADEDRFATKEKAERIEFEQRLFRKLQRFSDENGGNEIDWSSHEKKYFIAFSYSSGHLVVRLLFTARDFGQVYFISEEIAEKAIELFHDELIKYFTHDWSGKNE